MSGGRPTLYKAENADIARHACMQGATNETLGERFEVTRRTIDNWIATIPEFGAAVREGRQVADESVIAALYARATGMERKTIEVTGGAARSVTTTQTVQVLPDVRACMFWRRNRRPEQWRESRRPADEDDDWQELEGAAERARYPPLAGRASGPALSTGEEPDADLLAQAERLRVYP